MLEATCPLASTPQAGAIVGGGRGGSNSLRAALQTHLAVMPEADLAFKLLLSCLMEETSECSFFPFIGYSWLFLVFSVCFCLRNDDTFKRFRGLKQSTVKNLPLSPSPQPPTTAPPQNATGKMTEAVSSTSWRRDAQRRASPRVYSFFLL